MSVPESRDAAMTMMAEHFLPHYAADLEGIIQFDMGGDLDYHLVVQGGVHTLVAGMHRAPSLLLRVSPENYPEIFTGDLTQLFADGRLGVEGDLALGVTLAAMLRPQAHANWEPDRARIERVSAEGAPIERIERRSLESLGEAEFQRVYARASRPLILTGAMGDWGALELTPEALKARFGHLRVVPRVGNYVASAFTEERSYAPMSMAEYLDSLAPADEKDRPPDSHPPPYLGNNPVPDELLALMGVPPFCSSEACGRPSLWLGPAGTVTPLHRDLIDNVLVQIFGRKRLLLFSPEQSALLGTWQSSPLLDGTGVDPENPDGSAHPRFAEARRLECILEPAEMLFIPAGWFHHVRSLSVSFSVNFFKFYEPPAAMHSA